MNNSSPRRTLPSHSFFFNDTATTEIYTLSLHDALPIFRPSGTEHAVRVMVEALDAGRAQDRKSTRLNSSHVATSYAVLCSKKKKKQADAVAQNLQEANKLLFSVDAIKL